MNQTVTINISGIVFHIEVDAYEELKNYLNKIKSYFNNSQEREEIMADIEARIAELFNEKISDVNQVILMKDVQEVVEVMGKPEQYLSEEDEEERVEQESKTYYSSSGKKFFRNPDERVLGGVCSGIAAYFGFDTIWMRLFFVMTTLFLGFGPALYIILWIVIPEAKTASDKLQMRGEPINVDNIGKKVEEEAEKVNEKIKNIDSNKIGNSVESFFAGLGNVLMAIFNGLSKVIGVVLLVVGLFLGIWFLIGLFDDSLIFSYTSTGISVIEAREFFELIFSSQDQFNIFLIALIVVVAIPIVGLILGGIKMLFKINTNTGLGISLAILWFIGLFTTITLGLVTASEYKSDEKNNKIVTLPSSYNTYSLKVNKESMPGEIMLELDDFSVSLKDAKFYSNEVELTIEESDNDSLELLIINKAHGKTTKDALKKARSIDYQYKVQDSTIVFNNYWSTLKEYRLRGQEVELVLKMPIGTSVYLDESLQDFIYDIDNVTDTWDRDMLENKWIMLEDGLTCLNCNDIDGVTKIEVDSILSYEPIEE